MITAGLEDLNLALERSGVQPHRPYFACYAGGAEAGTLIAYVCAPIADAVRHVEEPAQILIVPGVAEAVVVIREGTAGEVYSESRIYTELATWVEAHGYVPASAGRDVLHDQPGVFEVRWPVRRPGEASLELEPRPPQDASAPVIVSRRGPRRENDAMPERFPLTFESREGIDVMRWIGDPDLPGWKRMDLWGDGSPSFVERHGMSGSAGMLYPALLGLVWRIANTLATFVLPVFDGVVLCERHDLPYALVDWEYGIRWEEDDWARRDEGFVRAESLNGHTDPSGRQRVPRAAFAQVDTWGGLLNLIPVGDQANTLCLFSAVRTEGARDRLVAALRSPFTPQLPHVVATATDLVAVFTHEDEGLGRSSMLIAGLAGMCDVVEREATDLEDRLERYLVETAAAENQAAWSAAADRFAAPLIEDEQP